jgi:hypothetical protein
MLINMIRRISFFGFGGNEELEFEDASVGSLPTIMIIKQHNRQDKP